MSDAEDDVPQLSAETFLALQQFYEEREEREKQLQCTPEENVTFDENWQLSQFWYDEQTIENLVKIAQKEVGTDGKIALISCPTLYKKMKESIKDGTVTLYEYDPRFALYGKDFVPYDYKSPLEIPRDKANFYDLVIADPPFLSDECLTKTAVTIKFLTPGKIILCTGAIMEELVARLLDLKKSAFRPQHKNNLANEFRCFSNFNIEGI